MKKNAATKIVFPILDADGDPVSGAADLDSEYSLNGGGFNDCNGEATEIGATGVYYLDLIAGETNGDVVCIQVKTSTSGAKTTVLVFYTAAQTLDELDTVCDGIKAVTDNLPDSGALTTIQADLDNPAQYKATGFSTHSAADVWSVVARTLTDKAGFSLAADQSGVTVGTVTTLTNWQKTGYALSAAGIDSIIDEVVEGTLTLRQAIRLIVSMMAGKSSGGGTATLKYRDYGDSKDRLTFTVDANGNRSAVTRDVG